MYPKEIVRSHTQLVDGQAYDPQSAKVVDFMNRHNSCLKSRNSDQADLAVVIPAYNEARLLPRCLASINWLLGLSGRDAHVIVVNNASNDATGEIATYFGAQVVHEPQKGIGQARQSGLMATNQTNHLILTTDADSVVPDNWFEAHEDNLSDPLVSFSSGGFQLLLDQKVSLNQKLGFYVYILGRSVFRGFKSRLFSQHQTANGANTGFRREQALEMGGYRTHLAAMEDYFMMVDLVESTGGVARPAQTNVATSSRRILQSGIFNYIKMRLKNNVQILTDKPNEPETYPDFRVS